MVSPAGGPQQTVIITATGSKRVDAPAPAPAPVSAPPAPAPSPAPASQPKASQEPIVVITATGSKKVAAAEIAANPDDYGVYVPPPPPPPEKNFFQKVGGVVSDIAVGAVKLAWQTVTDPKGATEKTWNFVKKNWKPLAGMAVAVVVTVVTFGAASGGTVPLMGACGAAILAGAAGGAAGALTTSTLEGKSGGEILKDTVVGGALGAAGGAIGGAVAGNGTTLASSVARGAAQGAVQGAGQSLVAGGSASDVLEGAFIGAAGGAAGGAVGHGVGGRFANPNGAHAQAITNGARYGIQGFTEGVLRGEDAGTAFANGLAGAFGGAAGSYASNGLASRLNRTAPTSARQAALRQGVINMAGNMARTSVTGLGRGQQNIFENTLMSGFQGFTEGLGEGYKGYRTREIAEAQRAREEALASKRRGDVTLPSDDEVGLDNVHLTSKNTRRVGNKFYYIDANGTQRLLADTKADADALQAMVKSNPASRGGGLGPNTTDRAPWYDRAYDWTADKLSRAYNWTADKFSSAYNWSADKVSRAYNWTTDKVSRAYDWTANKVSRAYDWTADKVSRAYNWTTDKVSRAYDWTVDKASRAYNWTTDKVSRAYSWTADKVSRGYDWATGDSLDRELAARGVRKGNAEEEALALLEGHKSKKPASANRVDALLNKPGKPVTEAELDAIFKGKSPQAPGVSLTRQDLDAFAKYGYSPAQARALVAQDPSALDRVRSQQTTDKADASTRSRRAPGYTDQVGQAPVNANLPYGKTNSPGLLSGVQRKGDTVFYVDQQGQQHVLAQGKEQADAFQAILPTAQSGKLAIRQGTVGDCYLLDALDGIQDKEYLMLPVLKGIKYDPKTQSYQVTLPGAKGRTYNVPKSELFNYNVPQKGDVRGATNSSARLVPLLEHAAAQHARTTGWSDPDLAHKNSLKVLNNGSIEDGYEILTGSKHEPDTAGVRKDTWQNDEGARQRREAFIHRLRQRTDLQDTSVALHISNIYQEVELGNGRRLKNNHAYNLQGFEANSGNLRITDPHDTSRPFYLSPKDAALVFSQIQARYWAQQGKAPKRSPVASNR